MKDLEERWAPHPYLQNLHVSTHGRAWLESFIDRQGRYQPPRMMKPIIDKGGYFILQHIRWKGTYKKLSRVVLETFVGLPPFEKAHAMHLDANKDNNHLYNLAWGTQRENNQMKYKNGPWVRERIMHFRNLGIGYTAITRMVKSYATRNQVSKCLYNDAFKTNKFRRKRVGVSPI